MAEHNPRTNRNDDSSESSASEVRNGAEWHEPTHWNRRTRLHHRIAHVLRHDTIPRLRRQVILAMLTISSDRALGWFAVVSATCRLPILAGLPIAGPALQVLGIRPSWIERLRFMWSLGYQIESQSLVTAQGERLTKRWIRQRVIPEGTPLPPGGAILLAIHQYNQTLRTALLAMLIQPLGIIVDRDRERSSIVLKAYGQNMYSGSQRLQTLRRSLRFLNQGGYLVVAGDVSDPTWPRGAVLEKSMAIPPGIMWLAQQSGKPIIPFALVPSGTNWRLWFGNAVEPTVTGVAAAVEQLIRKAPTNWVTTQWLAWQAAPPAKELT